MNFADLQNGPFFILGPCVIENQTILDTVATELSRLKDKYQVPIIFKASFDKANRTSVEGYRGPGMREGLEMLAGIKKRFGFPILTDIHESFQSEIAAD